MMVWNEALLNTALEACAEKNVLSALNPAVHFGFWSVCADRKGHGERNTYPGLDWGQNAEALLWLGRYDEVLANWHYVKGFMRADGRCPFAIFPDYQEACELDVGGGRRLPICAGGAIFEHWVPGNPLRTLANATLLATGAMIYRHTLDRDWLAGELEYLRRMSQWLLGEVTAEGLVRGAGYYVERPLRADYDAVAQGAVAHALTQGAEVLELGGDADTATACRTAAERIRAAFQRLFWTGDRFAEYLHPEHGAITAHGYTDADWAALAYGMATPEQVACLWPKLRGETDFYYDRMPTGLATRPELYEAWEVQQIDYHDIAAMGRVWYLEARARRAMGDAAGLLATMRMVAERGRRDDWVYLERYYSERTGDRSIYHVPTYCEYPANFLRIAYEYVLGAELRTDGALRLAPWEDGVDRLQEFALAFPGRQLRATRTETGWRVSFAAEKPWTVTFGGTTRELRGTGSFETARN